MFSIITPVSHDPSEIILIFWIFPIHFEDCGKFKDSLLDKKFKRTAFILNRFIINKKTTPVS